MFLVSLKKCVELTNIMSWRRDDVRRERPQVWNIWKIQYGLKHYFVVYDRKKLYLFLSILMTVQYFLVQRNGVFETLKDKYRINWDDKAI